MSVESLSRCVEKSIPWSMNHTYKDSQDFDIAFQIKNNPENDRSNSPSTLCSSVSNVSLASSHSAESPRRAYLRRRSSFAGLGNVNCDRNPKGLLANKNNSMSTSILNNSDFLQNEVNRVCDRKQFKIVKYKNPAATSSSLPELRRLGMVAIVQKRNYRSHQWNRVWLYSPMDKWKSFA